jgi:hypothetical protein
MLYQLSYFRVIYPERFLNNGCKDNEKNKMRKRLYGFFEKNVADCFLLRVEVRL